ncbi:MAG: hypothetical protein WA951_00170 [Leeuwenhoekiella sp.]
MKKNTIEDWFAAQQDECWDLAEPEIGHKQRFLTKLEPKSKSKKIDLRYWWKPLAVAASFLLLLVWSFQQNTGTDGKELAKVSPKMEETQDFFTAAIANELFKIKERRNPVNKRLIDDALAQLTVLETDYKKLEQDLAESGEDKRVIYAMITNFQTRIDLLQEVMKQLDNTHYLNTKQNEKQLF